MGHKAKRRAEKLARQESKAAAARRPRVEVMADTVGHPPPMRISQRTLDAASTQPELLAQTPWEIAKPAPGVVPEDVMREIAEDASIGSLYGYGQTNSFTDGMQWLGYPYLSELAQRPEYRRMVEQIAKEMTRKWIKLHAAGDDIDKDKARKLKIIDAQLKRHRVQAKFRRLAELDGFFGRGHLYIDTGHTAEPDELAIPLVRDKRKIGIGGLKRLKIVEPLWTYPFDYNTTDPLDQDFYRPRQWFVQGRKVHRSRLLTVIGREVPDMLKPAYAFGGVALTQMAKPYVENWLRTRQSVSDLIHSFSVSGLKTNLASTIAEVGADPLLKRIALFNRTRDNRGLLMIDKESEEFFNVSTPLGTLDHLQAQSQEQMASVNGIPLVVLLGITPSGLNACVPGNTLVETDRGQVPISEVSVADKVMTRSGWAPLAWAGITGDTTEFYKIQTAEFSLLCTANHPIYLPSTNAFVCAENVRPGDILLCHAMDRPSMAHRSYGEDDIGGLGQTATMLSENPASAAERLYSIAKFGASIMDLCQKVATSTISTTIAQTINSAISMCFPRPIMQSTMAQTGFSPIGAENARNAADIAAGPSSRPSHRGSCSVAIGAGLPRGEKIARQRLSRVLSSLASCAELLLRLSDATGNTVRANVQSQARTARHTCEPITSSTGIAGKIMAGAVMQAVVSIERVSAQEPIYDLSVADGYLPEFFANGICVHNSSDGEIKTWYAWIEAMQEHLFDDDLRVLLDIIQLSEFGEIDPEITHTWEPLWQLDEAGRAQVRKSDADTDMEYVNGGVISPLEVRQRLADAEDSLYPGLDVDDLPEPPGGGMEGADPLAGLPDPANANEPPPLADRDSSRPAKPKAPISPLQLAGDAWQEDDVDRAKNGQFSSGGGGGGGGSAAKKAPKVEDVSGWKKVGPQLGGNPGGKYESPEGDHYYIKQSKSDDHAKNEVLAGKLYQAAGAPVFHSRLVDTGGGKLGTSSKWKGDATDIKPSSKAERKEAQQHFATHAWLANHDAGGTDTYNQGKLNGVMHTMDVGGALNYAGLGGEKGAAFGHEAGEWDTMRQKGTASAKVHAIFADMTPVELKASAEKVAAIPDETIAALVEEHGPGDAAAKAAMTAKLIARKNDIAKKAGIEAKPAASEAPAASVPAAEASTGAKNQAFEDAHLRGPDGKFLPKPDDDASDEQNELYAIATEENETVQNKIFSVQDVMLESKDPDAVAYGQKLLDGLTAPPAPVGSEVPPPAAPATPAEAKPAPPDPPGYAGPAAKKIAEMTKAALAAGDAPETIAASIKDYAAGFKGNNTQTYAKNVIAHLEKVHGLAKGTLAQTGAVAAGGNPPPSAPAPPTPPVSPLTVASPPAEPAAPALHTPPVPKPTATQQYIDQYAKGDLGDAAAKIKTLAKFATASTTSPDDAAFTNAWITALGGTPEAAPIAPTGPEPNAASGPQQVLHGIATGYASTEDKVEKMKAVMQDMLDQGMSPTAPTLQFGEAWIKSLGGTPLIAEPQEPAAPAAPSGPMPHPDSAPQKAVYALATGAGTNAEKAEKIKAEAAGMYQGGYAKAYADEWITALGGDPATPVKPAVAAPKPKVAAKPKTPPANANSVKAPAARAAKGEALEASAKRPTSTDSAESAKIAPSLSPEFWKAIPAATKQSVASYGGSGYTGINMALRGEQASEASKKHVENLDDLFYHDESVTTEPVMVVRGEDTPVTLIAEWKAALTKGWPPCIYTRTGYTSASMAHSPAFSGKPVWLHFAAPKGTRMVGLAGLVGHHENEVLLQHGQTMEVYEIYEANGKTHVKCTLK